MSYITNKPDSYLKLLKFAVQSQVDRSEAASKTSLIQKHTISDILSPHNAHLVRPIYPLVYRNLKISDIQDQLDEGLKKNLRNIMLRLLAADTVQTESLKKVIRLFQTNKLPIILLKGAGFSGTIYTEQAPRLSQDIDILVKDKVFESACNLLKHEMQPVVMSPKRIATHQSLFERVFRPRSGQGPVVELHKHLTNPHLFNIDTQGLWNNSREHPQYRSEFIRTLSPEDTLLHLAVHAFRDLDFCTHNLLDAHEVWCRLNPDATALKERAYRWGAGKVLFYLLFNCKEIMDTPLPDTLLQALKPHPFYDTINVKILRSKAANRTNIQHRIIQLISQFSFPDHLSNGLKHQIAYANTRVKDWVLAKRPH